MGETSRPRVLLGVCGGIAAYKACELARELMRGGMQVQAVLTPSAAQFVTPLTFTALTGLSALVSEFDGAAVDVYAHLNLTRGIHCFVVAPATAGTIGKLAHGVADNLLTSAYLSNTAPMVIAPAMNVRMWEHPAVQANLALLRDRGHIVVPPAAGELACGDVGEGRLAEVERIAATVLQTIASRGSSNAGISNGARERNLSLNELDGRRIIVTAGGTREYLDPVRFLTNSSTGALGLEVVKALAELGAAVELIHTGIDIPRELADQLAGQVEARTAFDLQSALSASFPETDALVMLAAVADYGPTRYLSSKRKKDGAAWALELAETPDVLASLAPLRQEGQVVVGVSLEDTDWLARAQRKAAAKGADAMLAVELTGDLPFGDKRMHCALVTAESVIEPPARREKAKAATMLARWLARRLAKARNEQHGATDIQAVQST